MKRPRLLHIVGSGILGEPLMGLLLNLFAEI